VRVLACDGSGSVGDVVAGAGLAQNVGICDLRHDKYLLVGTYCLHEDFAWQRRPSIGCGCAARGGDTRVEDVQVMQAVFARP